MSIRPGSKTRMRVWTVEHGQARMRSDHLATEEPLEICVVVGAQRRTVAITMRTPGADFELAAGFLYTEQVIKQRWDIQRIRYCVSAGVDVPQQYNIVNVELQMETLPDLDSLERHFVVNSACGICGRTSLNALHSRCYPSIPAGPMIDPAIIATLPEQLHADQHLFALTGGLHAAALFNSAGRLVGLREDVGRHNAVDKLIGWALLNDLQAGHVTIPLHGHILLVSGRVSFEIMQKVLAAGIPIVCAVSAPSNLAVQSAKEFGITLIGFIRGDRFNVYSGIERLSGFGEGFDG